MAKPGAKRAKLDEQEEQSRLFKEKAREIGADQSGDDDEVMRRLAGQKRHDAPPPKSAQERKRVVKRPV